MRRRIEAELIRIDRWARAQHQDHTETVRPEWCPLCHPPARPRYRLTQEGELIRL